MHLIFILFIAFILIYVFIFNPKKAHLTANEPAKNSSQSLNEAALSKLLDRKVVYLAKGKLFYRVEGNEIKQIHSEHIQAVIDRMERKKQRHGWKENTSFGTAYASSSIKGVADKVNIQATSAQFIQDSQLIYFLKDDSFGGLFEYDFATKKEKRLLHRQNLFFHDLNLNPENQQMLCSQHASSGVANIALLNSDGSEFSELTGGDTVDCAPAWVPGEEKQILFQSAGIARDQEGYGIAHGPASIQMLDRESRKLNVILEDAKFDFMRPRVCPNGNLHFIRRPYKLSSYSAGQLFTDAVFFPFRLLRAVFNYLNFFSLMYSRKPLTSASGPKYQADLKEIILQGKKIDAENALRKESSVKGVPSLVPKSWQLIRRNRKGQETVLAGNVATYDITPDGEIIYSNGCGVFLLDNNNRPNLILKDKLIADVIVK